MCGWSVGVACLWRACLMEWVPFRGEKGLIGPDSFNSKKGLSSFYGLPGDVSVWWEKSQSCVLSFTGRLHYITLSAGFPGLSCSARTFWIYVHLIVNTGVCNSIQVSAHAIHSPLCTPAHPLGLPAQCPGTWPWFVCVGVSCTTSDTRWLQLLLPRRLQCCYHVCFESDLGAIKSTYCKHCNFFRCTHHVLWRQSSRSHQEPLSQMVIEAKGVSQAPFPLIVPDSYTHVFRCHFLNVKCFFSGIISRCLRYS